MEKIFIFVLSGLELQRRSVEIVVSFSKIQYIFGNWEFGLANSYLYLQSIYLNFEEKLCICSIRIRWSYSVVKHTIIKNTCGSRGGILGGNPILYNEFVERIISCSLAMLEYSILYNYHGYKKALNVVYHYHVWQQSLYCTITRGCNGSYSA
jgi:hypothetical protein